MLDVYYYLPKAHMDEIIGCGLKLSEWYDREVLIGGELKRCISTLLNPRDDPEKYKSDRYRLLRFSVKESYCYVADRYLYQLSWDLKSTVSPGEQEGLGKPEEVPDWKKVLDMYHRSLIPVEEYRFGTLRLPECLVFTTVIGEDIHIEPKGLGVPVLYEDSPKLYLNNVLEGLREQNDEIDEYLLYCFFDKLAEMKRFVKIEDKRKNTAVFLDKGKSALFCIKPPFWEGTEID